MNPSLHKTIGMLAILTVAVLTALQTDGAGMMDYSSFKLITERNIFDPNRYPHSEHHRPPPTVSRSAPAFGLVGTMDYRKGMFAFFDGNSPDYRVVLQRNGIIAGYTVTDITLSGVTLKSAGTNSTTLNLAIGGQMRLNGDTWEPAGEDLDLTQTDSGNAAAPAAGEDNTATPPAAESSGTASDILKRLMQQRAQEMK